MNLQARTPFKHGRFAAERDVVYRGVPDLLAGYFIGNGWMGPAPDPLPADARVVDVDLQAFAVDAPLPAAPAADGAVLDVQSGTSGTSAGEG